MKLKIKLNLFILFSLMFACSHSNSGVEGEGINSTKYPDPYHFPRSFFVEQSLALVTPEGTKNMTAQLQRQQDQLNLVLTDASTGLILTRLTLIKDQRPKAVFIAPVLKDKSFPALQIGEAIQTLYETKAVVRHENAYQVVDPIGRWAYQWSEFRSGKGCLFPQIIDLKFRDDRFHMKIALKDLDCTEPKG